MTVLDPIVVEDYVLVYVHSGLNSSNRPSFSFLRKCYQIFNRKYKKNLKQLFIVHPTFWIRTSFKLFRPFLSSKFWRKLTYIDNIEQLDQYIDRDEIVLPRCVGEDSVAHCHIALTCCGFLLLVSLCNTRVVLSRRRV